MRVAGDALVVTVVLVGLAAVAVVLLAPTNAATITSPGPLTSITIGLDFSCQVHYASSPDGEFFPRNSEAACGTFLANGATFGFSYLDGPTASPFTATSQGAVLGSGTASDPYWVQTKGTAGAGITLTEIDAYITGKPYYTTTMTITSASPAPTNLVLFRAGDCLLGGNDDGYGYRDISLRGIACAQDAAASTGRVIEWIPHGDATKSNYYEDGFSSVWSSISAGTPFKDTCTCATFQDNGGGISWTFTLAAGASVTWEHETVFSPNGLPPQPGSSTIQLSPAAPMTCEPGSFSATFSTTPPPLAPITYSWSFDDGSISALASPSKTFPTRGPHWADLKVKDGRMVDYDAPRFTFSPSNCPPSPAFSVIGDSLRAGQPFSFKESSTDSDSGLVAGCGSAPNRFVKEAVWDFGDNSPSLTAPVAQMPTHAYATAGSYIVSMRVKDCEDLASVTQATHAVLVVPNRPPVIKGLHDFSGYVGTIFRVPVSSSDPDSGQPLDFTTCQTPAAGGLDPPKLHLDAGDGMTPLSATFAWDSTGTSQTSVVVCLTAFDGESRSTGEFKIIVLRVHGDADQDGVSDQQDNCPTVANPDQSDTDHNGAGDLCDSQIASTSDGPSQGKSAAPSLNPAADFDHDGISDEQDNCPALPNAPQLDLDADGLGDACDLDRDGDGVGDSGDDCVEVYNPDQRDVDGDGRGDACSSLAVAATSTTVTQAGGPACSTCQTAGAPLLSSSLAWQRLGGGIAAAVAIALACIVLIGRWAMRPWK